MAEDSSDQKEEQIRVIEELEEVVVRLDVAKMSPLEKKGKMAANVVNVSPGELQELAAGDQVLDPESRWVEERAGAGSDQVPMGWFVLLVAALLGVLVWVFFQSKSPAVDEVVPVPLAEGGKEVEVEEELEDEVPSREELLEAEQHFEAMEKLVADFLAAGTVEEKAKFVRHPERVLPLMKRHYQSHELERLTFLKTLEYHIATLDQRPFIALNVSIEEGENMPLLVEDLPGGMLIDWESFVCYQPAEVSEFLQERPTDPVSFRVYAQKDNFYAYEFADESEYQCYRLTFRGSDVSLYGYVKRGTEVDQKFLKSFPKGGSMAAAPLILKVRFLEGGKGDRSVLVDDVDSRLWAYAQNPDEKTLAGGTK